MSAHFHSIAVVGAGAVGSFYGALLARAGHRVVLIGRTAHVIAIQTQGLKLDMAGEVHAIWVDATEDLSAIRDADLILVCVKSPDTDAVAQAMAPHIKPGAVVLSLQNGVENAPSLARHLSNPVFPTVVYVATALIEPGTVKHFGRGELVIGALDAAGRQDPTTIRQLDAVVELFASAGIVVTQSEDVIGTLWAKLMINCAYNALSALGQANYAQIAALPALRQLQHDIVQEVIAVAAADGVTLSLEASMAAVDNIAVTMSGQRSSTAQDLARHKPSEIDHLNGFIARRGRELGVPTPVNRTLHGLVKLVESGWAAS